MTRFNALQALGSHEFTWCSNPVCPSCGAEIDVMEHHWIDLYSEGTHEKSCPFCKEQFKIKAYTIFRFDTNEQEEE